MPRGPRGEKRPADVIGNAIHVMRIATREIRPGQLLTLPQRPAPQWCATFERDSCNWIISTD
jgi:hypothetical protein